MARYPSNLDARTDIAKKWTSVSRLPRLMQNVRNTSVVPSWGFLRGGMRLTRRISSPVLQRLPIRQVKIASLKCRLLRKQQPKKRHQKKAYLSLRRWGKKTAVRKWNGENSKHALNTNMSKASHCILCNMLVTDMDVDTVVMEGCSF